MLSLFTILALLVVCFLLLRRFRRSNLLKVSVLVLVVTFVVEACVYGYFLSVVARGGDFLLIGNQKVLDELLKFKLIKAAHYDATNRYSIYRIDPDLGYTVAENKYMGRFPATNQEGMRADRNYALLPDEDTLRMAAFGDSFVFCDGEITQNTWPYFLEKSAGNLEVLNFGVSGYGLVQSYLRLLNHGIKYRPDIIFVNYITLTARDGFSAYDIVRGRNLLNADLYRVRAWIEDGLLRYENMSPLDLFDRDFRNEHIYRSAGVPVGEQIWDHGVFSFFNTALLLKTTARKREILEHSRNQLYEDPAVNVKIIENLIALARESGATLLFFFHKPFADLSPPVRGLLAGNESHIVYVNSSQLLDQAILRHGYRREDLMNETNHYNPQGNQVYAEAVASVLLSRRWGVDQRTFRFNPATKSFENIAKDNQ